MMRIFLALLLFTPAVFAADVSVSWTQPVQNMDGTAIPATGPGSIQTNRVQWGTCNGPAFGTLIGSFSFPAATSYVVTGLAPAAYCFRAYAINTYGQASAASNVSSKAVDPPTPNPPVLAVPVIAGMLQTPVYSITAAGATQVRTDAIAGTNSVAIDSYR